MVEKLVEFSCRDQRERAMNRESIIPSRQSKAERRWVRWSVRPVRPSINAEESAKWVGVIRLIVEFNHKLLSRNQMFFLN